MRLVIIESPHKGDNWKDLERNNRYLRSCIRDCLSRGESPFASHRMFTDALDDTVPAERELGIQAGLAWRRSFYRNEEGLVRHVVPVFYVDLGFSGGMSASLALYEKEGIAFERRVLPTGDPFFGEAKDV